MRAMRAFLALIQAVVASLLEAVGQLAVAAAVRLVQGHLPVVSLGGGGAASKWDASFTSYFRCTAAAATSAGTSSRGDMSAAATGRHGSIEEGEQVTSEDSCGGSGRDTDRYYLVQVDSREVALGSLQQERVQGLQQQGEVGSARRTSSSSSDSISDFSSGVGASGRWGKGGGGGQRVAWVRQRQVVVRPTARLRVWLPVEAVVRLAGSKKEAEQSFRASWTGESCPLLYTQLSALVYTAVSSSSVFLNPWMWQ